jgi:2-amino-4-hydroxy-6-hydroxymethyldihydropteridine diphosphokinase
MTTAYIGIGSNVGERRDFVRKSLEALLQTEGIEVSAVSSLYETAPVGGPPQRSFVNAVVRVETELDARSLLEATQAIERGLGRGHSDIRWGPRVIDLDILLFGEEKISEADIEIPHPRMKERNFVLVPLLEIAPDVADPWGTPLAEQQDDAEGDVALLEPF